MKQPPRLNLAHLPTPLAHLPRLSAECGTDIWVKRDDMTEFGASGNKIRKLEFVIAQAMAEKADVLVTFGGVQSNHCRATALLARRLGLRAHLMLRGSEPCPADGNLLLDLVAGAEITYLTPEAYQQTDELIQDITEHYAAKGLSTYVIPVGASDEVGLWGYIDCAAELKRDFEAAGIAPSAIVSATGSGGTLGGLIVGKALHGLDAEVVAFNVCDDEAYFVNKITADLEAWMARYEHQVDAARLPINVIDGYVGPGYGRATPDVFATIGRVARTEGMLLDPVYTGKAFHGMLQELEAGRFGAGPVVFLHTGGGFGLFAHKSELIEHAAA